MELSKPGSHAWEAVKGQGLHVPAHSLAHSLWGSLPTGDESRGRFISCLLGVTPHPPRGAIAQRGQFSTRSSGLLQLTEDSKRTAYRLNGVGLERYEFLRGKVLTARGLIDFTELCDKSRDRRFLDVHKVQNERE